MSRRLAAVCLAALALLAPLTARAVVEAPFGVYFHTAWTVSDGAPPDVLAIAQDDDGWLWLASSQGLYRFDGDRFEHVESFNGQPLRRSNVMSLAWLDGALWLGYQFGGVERIKDGVVTFFDEASGLPGSAVHEIVQTKGGQVSAATSRGLYDWDGKQWRRAWPAPAEPPQGVLFALATADGALLINGDEGILRRKAGSQAFVRIDSDDRHIFSLFAGRHGGFWAASTAGFMEYDPVRDRIPGTRPRPESGDANHLYFTSDGANWMVIDGGIRLIGDTRVYATRAELTRAQGLSDPSVLIGFEDREGNFWLGTSGGVDRLRHSKVHAFDLPANVHHPAMALAADGAVWVGAQSGTPLQEIRPGGGVVKKEMAWVESVLAARDGGVWAGNDESVRHFLRGVERRWPLPGPQPNLVQVMAEDSNHGLWISMIGHRTLYRLYNGSWETHAERIGFDATPIFLLIDDRDRLWQAFTDNRLAVADGKQVTRYTAADGLRIGNILSVAARLGRVWVGGEKGVMFLRAGKFSALKGSDGSEFPNVSGIVDTANGDLWLNGAQGVTHIAAAALRRALADSAGVAYEQFDYRDGIVGRAPSLRPLPSLREGADRRIWYMAGNTVGWIDPAHIARNARPPVVKLRALVVNDRRYALGAALALPEGSSNVRIDYTALSPTMPERLRFRYRLHGVDDGWVDPGARRSAFYTNLQPGHYRFEVEAANEDGVWSKVGASQQFDVAPTVVQTLWFRAACVMAALLALLGLHQWRIQRQVFQLQARMNERLDERGRIARELHDTLLQAVQGLVLKVHGASVRLAPQEPVRELLDQALEQAENTIVEGRNLVRDLRVQHDGLALPALLSAVGRELAGAEGPLCEVVCDGEQRPLQPDAGNQLFAIGREAMVNACRHAGAARLRVGISYGARQMQLTVSDDGGGIPDEVLAQHGRNGHWGMQGMLERAERIGASVVWQAGAGGGTDCVVSLPAARAYAAGKGGWRGWRLRR
jgi:signal transduction histidine kinase/ligand-binding sensor domain-containing protein